MVLRILRCLPIAGPAARALGRSACLERLSGATRESGTEEEIERQGHFRLHARDTPIEPRIGGAGLHQGFERIMVSTPGMAEALTMHLEPDKDLCHTAHQYLKASPPLRFQTLSGPQMTANKPSPRLPDLDRS
jgi:hypothetical protein